MNIVIYARYSSEKQTEQSIEGQLRVCKEYAKKHSYTILKEYIDREKTGQNDKRPAFLEMIEDAKKQEFNYILVYKLDRFSRDKYDNAIYKHQLKQYNVKVISATENIDDSPEGELLEGILEIFASMYIKDLSQKTKRGMRESILKGNTIGGIALYGYKVVDKKIVIDQEKAAAIRYLFEEYANGKSKKKIIEELNNKGYRTRQGKKLTVHNFQNNLKNKKYTGVFDNGELINKNYYPAIISKDLFDKVQLKLEEHKRAPATQKAKIEYVLTGKAFCGYCGANLFGISGTSRTGKSHTYYYCSAKRNFHSCKKSNERKDELEKLVVEQTLKYVLQKEQIDKIIDNILQKQNENAFSKQISELEKQIAQIENDLDKCFNIFWNANPELQKRINEKAESLQLQKQDLEANIKKLKLASSIKQSKQDIAKLFTKYLNGNVSNIDYQRKIIQSFVNSVFVFDDKIVIYYNLFGNKKITFEEAIKNLSQRRLGKEVLILNNVGSQKSRIRTFVQVRFFYC